MAFVVAKRPVAAFPIKTTVFDESGQSVQLEFVAQYHRHTPEQLADLQDGLTNRARKANGMEPIVRGDGTPVPDFPYPTDIAFIRDKMAGWAGVQEPDGRQKPFSCEELTATVAAYPELIGPLFTGFFGAHQGAREKN